MPKNSYITYLQELIYSAFESIFCIIYAFVWDLGRIHIKVAMQKMRLNKGQSGRVANYSWVGSRSRQNDVTSARVTSLWLGSMSMFVFASVMAAHRRIRPFSVCSCHESRDYDNQRLPVYLRISSETWKIIRIDFSFLEGNKGRENLKYSMMQVTETISQWHIFSNVSQLLVFEQ